MRKPYITLDSIDIQNVESSVYISEKNGGLGSVGTIILQQKKSVSISQIAFDVVA